MNIKKTHILLIIMSLFLLVSIGSVCAHDVVADEDIQTSPDGSDVVLNDEEDSGSEPLSADETTPEKVNTTVTTDKASYKVGYDEDKNITGVTVKDNESQKITDLNESNFTVFEGEKQLNFKYNNTIITITDTLSVGEHNLTINYLGNSNYNKSSTNTMLKVFGNKTLDVGTIIIVTGDVIEIPVTVSDGVDNLTFIKEDFADLTLTYTNETGNRTTKKFHDFSVAGGKIIVTIQNIKLISASLTINYINGTDLNKTASLKLNTTVNANDATIKEEADKNITISVSDYNSEQLSITKDDLQVLVDGKEVKNFVLNNNVITLATLARGNHTLKIVYKGNDTYYTSSKEIKVGIYGNLTINPPASANVGSDKYVEITLNLSNGTEYVEIVKGNLNIILKYVDESGELKNRTISQSDINITGQIIRFKVNETFSSANATITYQAETNLTKTVAIKLNTTITANNQEFGDNQNMTIPITVKASNGANVNVTKDNIELYDGTKKLEIDVNNSVIIIKTKLQLGNYTLTIKFKGNDTFSDASKVIALKVYGINATAEGVNSTGIVKVKVNVTDGNSSKDLNKNDFTLKVDYKNGTVINLTASQFELNNGTITFTLDELNFTKITLVINYKNNESIKNVDLNRIYNVYIIPVNVETEYQDGNFTFKLVDADNNQPLAGKTVTISGKLNDTSLVWQKWNSQTSLEYMSGSVELTSDANGIITLSNSGFYTCLKLPVTTDLLDTYPDHGEYNITISGKNVVGKNTTLIKINEATVNIKILAFDEFYGTTQKLTIQVTNAKTGNPLKGVYVLLNITGATLTYPRQITNSKGQVELGVTTLPPGKYPMNLKANDTNLNNKSVDDSFTIKKIPITISTNNVNIYYNSGTTTSIKIFDKRTNKPIAKAYVIFTVDSGNPIVGLTDSNGVVAFTASLNVGKHKLTVTNVYNPEGRDVYQYSPVTRTINVIKASAIIKAPQVAAYYKGNSYFTVTLINAKTKKPIFNGAVEIKVYVSKNKYYSYKGSTGTNGKIRLLIDMNPGTYKVEVSGNDNKNFAAKKVTSKIVVKKAPTRLIPVKLVAKKGKNTYFKVAAKNLKTKKPIAGIVLKIKVYTGKKAKTYSVKTNSKGIAQLNVKSLTVGKHIVLVSSGNKYCVAKAAKSLITIRK